MLQFARGRLPTLFAQLVLEHHEIEALLRPALLGLNLAGLKLTLLRLTLRDLPLSDLAFWATLAWLALARFPAADARQTLQLLQKFRVLVQHLLGELLDVFVRSLLLGNFGQRDF